MQPPPLPFDLSYKHLQLMLMRIDLLIHREARRWQRANQDAADLLRGQYISDSEVNALLKLPFGMHWRHLIAENGDGDAYERAMLKTEQKIELLLSQSPATLSPRLTYLTEAFGLTPFERDALLIVLAPAFDLRYERLYGYLLDDATRKRPSVNLVLDLLCEPNPQRLLMLPFLKPTAKLFKYNFIELIDEPGQVRPPLLNRALIPDPALVAWLLGDFQPHHQLREHVELRHVEQIDADLLVAAERMQQLVHAQTSDPILAFHGPDEETQKAAARLLAYQTQRPLLQANIKALIEKKELSPATALRLILRDAALAQAIPLILGWDACLQDAMVSSDLLRQLLAFAGMGIVASEKRWQRQAGESNRPILWLDFPVPAYQQRLHLWQHYVGDADALNIEKLAGQFILQTGQIRDVVRAGRDRAVQFGRILTNEDLFTAAREYSSPKLGDLARKIKPRYDWDDLVLPRDPLAILREIVNTVLERPRVLDLWGAGAKLAYAGVTVLFAGPPGTGKTMAAEVIARELELDLYKIDLSSVVSKYIGETEKNLERIFNEAQSSNAILFFDEADAIFGKRSEVKDAHDRYANLEVSYLLQRMESYDGVTILATNLRANLDEAFMRRLQFAVDFPFPEIKDRLRIWETLFPTTIPRANDVDFNLFAQRFRMAGGNIRNIIVSAAYLAAADGHVVTMEHLMHGARREMQKMGRLVDKEDFRLS